MRRRVIDPNNLSLHSTNHSVQSYSSNPDIPTGTAPHRRKRRRKRTPKPQQSYRPLSLACKGLVVVVAVYLFLSWFPALYYGSMNDFYFGPAHIENVSSYTDMALTKAPPYVSIETSSDRYQTDNCPENLPEKYPRDYPVLDVLDSWPLFNMAPRAEKVRQGLCIFDFAKSGEKTVKKATKYEQADVPFVLRNDPAVVNVAQRWQTPYYLAWRMQQQVYQGEFTSEYSRRLLQHYRRQQLDVNDTSSVGSLPAAVLHPVTYHEWAVLAEAHEASNSHYRHYAQLRLDSCVDKHDLSCSPWYYRLTQVPWGLARMSNADWVCRDFLQSAAATKEAIGHCARQCRFSSKGSHEEGHFSTTSTSIFVLGGSIRFIIGNPSICKYMTRLPSLDDRLPTWAEDWVAPNLTRFPNFAKVRVHEVVLQSGDVLQIPAYWFRYAVSLETSYVCMEKSNTRPSGHAAAHNPCGLS